jgi:hypothetical protein
MREAGGPCNEANVGSNAGRTFTTASGIAYVNPNFAQEMANTLGANVWAPNNYIWFFTPSDPQPGVSGYSYGVYGETVNSTTGAVSPNFSDPGKMVEYNPQHGYIIPP